MTITLQFHGAARHVTGSRHLVSVNDRQILLECGMVQGPRKISDQANRDLGVDVGSLDAVVLSHAHIDHSGSLPRLVRLGYRGPIYCTEATESLLTLLLADSAHIQAQDAHFLRKRGHEFEPPYDIADVEKTLGLVRGMPYHRSFEVVPEVRCEFLDAGHILGSAMVVLDVDDGGGALRISFTGDHGRAALPILRAPERLPRSDYLITESTYGDRLHPPIGDLEGALADIVNEEMRDGGRILIPAFSIGRTQNIVLYLGRLMEAGQIPRIPIFVDSPLSTKATKAMSRHAEVFDDTTRAILAGGRNPFFFDGVRYVADVEESKALNGLRSGVILAASGMCEAGRILHHLEQSIGRREDCVLMVGYQGQGTLGRKLLDGYERVKIFGERRSVRCRVRSMPGLSAHADHAELLRSTRHLAADAAAAFVVHGEESAALTYADRLEQAGFRQTHVPVRGQRYVLRA